MSETIEQAKSGLIVEPSRRRELPVVVPVGATSLIQAIAQAAANPSVDMDKMERLFKMHQQMVAHDDEAAFNEAMARAQKNIVPVVNNSKNEFAKNTYADMEAVNRAIMPFVTAEGISISFNMATCPIVGFQRTIALVSKGAHTREYHIDLPPDDVGSQGKVNKTAVQAAGSTNSYARRYLVRMIFNVSTYDDDDGAGSRKTIEGMPQSDYESFVKRIEAETTKPGARKIYDESVKVCNSLRDVESHKGLKAVLLAHGKLIDEVAAKEKKA